MDVRKPIIAGLMGLTTIAPCKAQKTVQLVSETGISGVINKEASFYGGLNCLLPKGKNFTDLYAGISVDPHKKASFVGLAINDYAWNKNISSWARETFVASNRGANSILEVAPVRANATAGKFNFSITPSYALYNDFKSGTTTQGFNPIFQTTYSASDKLKLFFIVAFCLTLYASSLIIIISCILQIFSIDYRCRKEISHDRKD